MKDLTDRVIELENRIKVLERAEKLRKSRLYSEGMKDKKVSVLPGDREHANS